MPPNRSKKCRGKEHETIENWRYATGIPAGGDSDGTDGERGKCR